MKHYVACALCALLPHILLAQPVTVTTLADAGPGSLRQAIVDVAPGGTIAFHPSLIFGTITLTSGELVIGKPLTIIGPGADRLAVSGNDASRVFFIDVLGPVTITDMTIRDGKAADGFDFTVAEDGGGIYNRANLKLVQVVMGNNRSGDGADSDPAHSSGGDGGAVFNDGGTVTLIRSTIENNSTGNGGDCLDCTDSFPRGGTAGGGGAIASVDGTVRVIRSAIINNQTGDGGNCVNCSGDAPRGGNGGPGAGLFAPDGGSLDSTIVESSTISGNETGTGGSGTLNGFQGWGGGINASNIDLLISHSTITDNVAFAGGGVENGGGEAKITVLSSIIAGNVAGGSLTHPEADCSESDPGKYISNGYNLFGDFTGCGATGTGDQTITPANVFTLALGPLQQNGGPTQTHALLPTSPAIDQGSCTGVGSDQRGYGGSPAGPRIFDDPRANADDGCDSGAYEFQGVPLDLIVHFKRPDGWGHPRLHYFSTIPDIGGTTWPGELMVHEGCGWYRYRLSGAGMAHMVFNGNPQPQTVDLFRSGEGWYDGRANVWSEKYPDVPCTGVTEVRPRIFLQGPYQGAGEMASVLSVAGSMPSSQPYGGEEFTDPLEHNGDETWANILPASFVTDWSIVELRTAHSADSKVAAKAAIHLYEGSIIDPEFLGPVRFPGVAPGSYYVVVRHRNHLPVMSANAVDLSAPGTVYDFTDHPAKAYGTSSMVQMPDGPWAMWAADARGDGYVQALDFNEYLAAKAAGASGYELADFDMDGNVGASDFNLYVANASAGASSQVP